MATPADGPPAGIPLLTPPPIPGIEQLKKDLTASVDYLVALTAIMIWDVISTFPSEFRYIWKAPSSHVKVLFLLNRYGSLVLQILNMSLVVANVSPQFCRNFFWFTPFVGTYVLTLCGTIFALHVWKLYGRRRNIGGILVGALCGMLATMASTGAQFTHVDLSPAAEQFLDFYGCIAAGRPGQTIAPTILFWAAPFVFSVLLLAMALHHSLTTRNNSNGKGELSVISALLRDGIWYLTVAATVNLVSVVLASQTANPNLHNFNAAGSVAFNFVMASRLVLSEVAHSARVRTPSSSAVLTPGSRDTPRFNPTFPSSHHQHFAAERVVGLPPPRAAHARGSPRRHGRGADAASPLESDDEKYDPSAAAHDDLEAGQRGEGGGGGGGIEMERKCSEATLADNRSFKSKASDATFQITSPSAVAAVPAAHGHGTDRTRDELDRHERDDDDDQEEESVHHV